MTMLEPADPWRRPRRPGAGGKAASLGTATADRPGDHIPLPAVPVAAGWARRRSTELLHARGVDPDTIEVISLLISELVTNALLHGVSAAAAGESTARCAHCDGQLCLNLREEPGAIVIEVFDTSALPPRRQEGAFGGTAFRDVGLDEPEFDEAERGRGLLLVANLSEEQGYYLPENGGKVVWCAVKAEV